MARRQAIILPCLLILVAASALGLAFNMFMPQGIGFLPPEIARPNWKGVSLDQAVTLYEKGALFVDARKPSSYQQSRIKGAVSIPLEDYTLLRKLLSARLEKAAEIVVYGKGRSSFPAAGVAQKLISEGLTKVVVMDVDLDEWQARGLPMRRPKRRAK